MNRLRGTAEALVKRLAAVDVRVDPYDEMAVRFVSGPPPVSLAAFAEGLFQPQDLTAISVVRALAPQPGEVIVDYCAGIGTKTAAIAELADNKATLIATDRDAARLELARQDFERLGVTCVHVVALSDLPGALERAGRVDAILADVPCSNSGVLARRPDARYRVDTSRLKSLGAKQVEILEQAASIADDHTRIVYSTCSLEPEENERQVERFCHDHAPWRVSAQWLTLPNAADAHRVPRDGGFCAVLRRTAGPADPVGP